MDAQLVTDVTQLLSILIGVIIFALASFDTWCYPRSRAFLIIAMVYAVHLMIFYVAIQFLGVSPHGWSVQLRIHGATSLVVVLYTLAERAWRAKLWKRGFLSS